MLKALSICGLFIAVVLSAEVSDYVLTPYGYRLKQCVMEVPSGSFVAPDPNGKLRVESHMGTSTVVKTFDSPPECGADLQRLYNERQMRKKLNGTAPFPINGWLDYGGWYPSGSQANLQKYTSTYTIPNNPTTVSTQTLFYFIGMQDNEEPNYLNIIQPVLTWGNGNPSWYVQSWACCPNNITVSSPPVTGLKPGQTMNGLINRVSKDVWDIDSEWQGQHTTLMAQVGDMLYNWAAVTLEVYNVYSCGQFATGKFTSANMKLSDAAGQSLSPNWAFTGATSCSGVIQGNAQTVTISHS